LPEREVVGTWEVARGGANSRKFIRKASRLHFDNSWSYYYKAYI
jgi:hypothetical protein